MSLSLNDNEVVRFAVSETNAQPSLWQVRAGFDMTDYDSWNTNHKLIAVILFKPYISKY